MKQATTNKLVLVYVERIEHFRKTKESTNIVTYLKEQHCVDY